MRIVCLNGWGGRLHDRLVDYVRSTDPDVLCLQEVVHTPASERDWLDYRDGDHVLPQRANFFGDLVRALPHHGATFCPAAQGVLWDVDGRAIPSQWGIATFVRKRVAVIGQIQSFIHKGFSADGYGAHPRSRNAHAVRLYDFERGWPVSIIHAHGLRDPAGKMDTPARMAQAQKLAELARAIAVPGDRIVLCGDFNIEPDSATFGLLAEAGLHDLVTGRGHEGTRTSHYRKPGRFADYMLVNDIVEVRRFDVVTDPEVSDHCPLLLEI
ncbi:MAG: endonuclease/exonuclease/phosphatase family protein [Rhizobium sp.]|nr:endonuclease/exonuclease/phosphatase family protein [Rhizobium sp.]